MRNKLLVLVGEGLNAPSPTNSATIIGDGAEPITLEEINTLDNTEHNAVLISAHGDVINRGESGEHAILSDLIGEEPIKIIDCIRQIQEQTGINVFFISGCHVGAAMPGLEALPPGTTVYLGASSKYPTTKREGDIFVERVINTYNDYPDLEEMQKQFFARQILESPQTIFRHEVFAPSGGDEVGNKTVKIKAISPKDPNLLDTPPKDPNLLDTLPDLVEYLKGNLSLRRRIEKNAELFQTDNEDEELAQSFIEGVRSIIEDRIKNLDQQGLKDLLDKYIIEAAFEAIIRGNIPRFEEWFKKGAIKDINHTDNEGATLILYAAYNSNPGMAKLLIDRKADINKADNEGTTPILRAVRENNLEIVQLLIDHKADINKADKEGTTPLLCAVRENNLEIVQLLIDHQADINKADKEGTTPILCAALRENLEMVRLLIGHRADINKADNEGTTPMLCAVYHGNLGMARLLIRHIAIDRINRAMPVFTGVTLAAECIFVAVKGPEQSQRLLAKSSPFFVLGAAMPLITGVALLAGHFFAGEKQVEK
jgi:hypothetical protein